MSKTIFFILAICLVFFSVSSKSLRNLENNATDSNSTTTVNVTNDTTSNVTNETSNDTSSNATAGNATSNNSNDTANTTKTNTTNETSSNTTNETSNSTTNETSSNTTNETSNKTTNETSNNTTNETSSNTTNANSTNTTNDTSSNTTNSTTKNTTNGTSSNTTNETSSNTTNENSTNNTNGTSDNGTTKNTTNGTSSNTTNETSNVNSTNTTNGTSDNSTTKNTTNGTSSNTTNETSSNTTNENSTNTTNGTSDNSTTKNTTNGTSSNITNETSSNTTNENSTSTTNGTSDNITNSTSNATIHNDTNVCINPFLRSAENPNGIPGLQAPVQAGSLNYCNMLKNQTVCCSDSVINNLTVFYQDIRDNLTAYVKTRDQNISIAKDALSTLVENFKALMKIQKEMIATLNKLPGGKSLPSIFNTSTHSRILSSAFDFANISMDGFNIPAPFMIYYNRTKEMNFTTNISDADALNNLMESYFKSFKSNFIRFQKARKTCFDHLLKRFTKFICMGCSSNASLFYTNQKLFLKKDFCTATVSSCYEYLSLNELFSGFDNPIPFQISSNMTTGLLNTLTQIQQAFNDMINSPTAATMAKVMNMTAQLKNIGNSSSGQALMNLTYNIKRVPQDCSNSTNCQYICDNFINLHGINHEMLINPGVFTSLKTNQILRQLATVSSDVVYDENGYNVENVTSGAETQVSFSQDPANQDTNFDGNSSNFGVGSIFSKNMMIFGLLALIMICIF